jgi:hypothetical protein
MTITLMKTNNCAFVLLAVLGVFCGRLVGMEPEIEKVLIKLKARFDKPESREIYETLCAAAANKNPRIFELARRINIDDGAWGGMNHTKEFLYAQIDEVIFESTGIKNGVLAARVIRFVGRDAVSLTYWRRAAVDSSMLTKDVWMRRMPDKIIDQASQLASWHEVQGKKIIKASDLACIESLCDDPMPPTVVPLQLQQEQPEAAVIEFVTRAKGQLKYRWAIRSNKYTSDYERFLKAWDKLQP